MKIQFRDNDCTECWDGVFYKKLSNYPNITEREIQTIMDFISYEKSHGRECELDGEEQIVSKITEAMEQNNRNRVPVPAKIQECTACPKYKGCMTDLVCHTSPVENAIQILACGSLLSPVKARKESAQVSLKDWVHAIIVPLSEKENTERFVPDALKGKVHYIENDCRDIWEWSEKVYEFAKSID